MNLEEFNIIIFVTGIIIGGIVTLVVKNIIAKNSEKKSDASANILTMKMLQEEIDTKQAMIDSFFAENNEKMLEVEKTLAGLRDNLAQHATQISNVDIKPSDKELPSIEMMDYNNVTPPRDYASKLDNDKGMLSDSFGLHDSEKNLEPKRTI